MQASEAEISNWLAAQQGAMVDLLQELVDTDSGSYDKNGVDAVGVRLAQFLSGHGIATTTMPIEEFGNTLLSGTEAVRRDRQRHNFLLLGHRDTVFGKGEVERRPFKIVSDRAYGPGVADMKAGLVMNAFVLAAFARFAPSIPVASMTTGDEEIGSQASRSHIAAEARFARAVFNAEPGRANGNVVTGRKGGFTYRFDITGKAAHSGVNFTEGASAIGELAHKVIALHELTRVDEGVTLSVGLISGGSSANTIAGQAGGELDVRFVTRQQRGRLIESIESILTNSKVAGTSTVFAVQSESLPLLQSSGNKHLSACYLQTARALGFDIAGEFTGGCADSGITAWEGAPTICGVGPVGGKAHTVDEYIELGSLAERARIAAGTICALWQGN
jgi:glutamate carboxypeptidase